MLGGVVGGVGAGREGSSGGGRGRVTVQFMEKNKAGRRRMGMWGGKGEEDVCWESWTVRVTVAEPKTDSGEFHFDLYLFSSGWHSLFCVESGELVVKGQMQSNIARSTPLY